MFQEVVDRTLNAHLRPHLTAAGFTLLPNRAPERDYYEVIAVRPPSKIVSHEVHALPSQMGRELVEVIIERDGLRWMLLTGHLESLKGGAKLRVTQARSVLERMRAHEGPAVFAGDTNLRQVEADRLGPLVDAWEACGSSRLHRWTWGPSKRSKARFDRIWGDGVVFDQFRTTGRDAVTADGQRPSDHLAVRVEVRPE